LAYSRNNNQTFAIKLNNSRIFKYCTFVIEQDFMPKICCGKKSLSFADFSDLISTNRFFQEVLQYSGRRFKAETMLDALLQLHASRRIPSPSVQPYK
jgi:hypothetical protein